MPPLKACAYNYPGLCRNPSPYPRTRSCPSKLFDPLFPYNFTCIFGSKDSMSAVDGAPQGERESIGAQLGARTSTEQHVTADDVKKESSKEVQKERQVQFRRRHDSLVGFFGLILYESNNITIIPVTVAQMAKCRAESSISWASISSSVASSSLALSFHTSRNVHFLRSLLFRTLRHLRRVVAGMPSLSTRPSSL